MTFSIVGRDAATGDLGVAVASKFLAVGSAVPAARYGVGAIATQAFANTLYRRDGMAQLKLESSAQEVVQSLVAADALGAERQVGVVDRHGGAATYTGPGCHDWAGGVAEQDVAIEGNILVGARVVDAMHAAWVAAAGEPLPRRLLAALTAGDEAGGDRRGRQSAAMYVVSATGGYTPGDDLAYDLRVDDHQSPVPELARLLDLHDLYFGQPADEDLLPLNGDLAAEVGRRLADAGYADLASWAGVENLEMRLRDGLIDRTVLQRLRDATT
ncbi:DUF1028 domain-containing protein [Leekyejoonella antrihumi]|uniref:DUF1028 domain-containing protein n=1 Tax=Leekyejoonella antrihumi TaxID=1660198 RepID=A0A563DZ39_9MICO|nr:DUF1028 domain-containing protein [Leekyejoonella antrihumi]TWP35465.1 DUF1028 domain-containing protein [Leekyejoonella antrihumi]